MSAAHRARNVVVGAFCLLIAGANLSNALMPLFAGRFALAPVAQSTLFVLYLAALVVGLLVIPRLVATSARAALVLLVAGAVVSVAADVAMSAGAFSVLPLAVSRLLSGVAVALGTGGAASLALVMAGERGRAAVATGAVLGSLLGNVGVAAAGLLTPSPLVVIPLAHATLTVLSGVALVLLPRPQRDSAGPPAPARVAYQSRHRLAGYVVGGMSWTAAGIVLALIPTALRAHTGADSLLLASAPGGVMLATAFAAQTVLRSAVLRLRAWMVSIPLVVGVALLGLALAAGSVPGLLAAGFVIGLGQGPAYSAGLVTVSQGLGPIAQARAASLYAAAAYGICGVLVVIAGALATAGGDATAVLVIAGLLSVAAVASTALAGARQIVPGPIGSARP